MESPQSHIDRAVIRQVGVFTDANRQFLANVMPAALRGIEERERATAENPDEALSDLDFTG